MEFQVPHNGDEDDEELYQDIIYYLTETLDLHVSTDRRFYYLRFKDEGQIYEAEVGKVFEPIDEVVITIFEGGMIFYICTQNRGVPGSDNLPMMVDKAGKILYHKEFNK